MEHWVERYFLSLSDMCPLFSSVVVFSEGFDNSVYSFIQVAIGSYSAWSVEIFGEI